MFTLLYNLISRSLIVLLVAMLSINYLPETLFHDFPLEPKSVESVNFDSVIPQQWNTKLSDNQPEYIQLNNLLGPESIAVSKNGMLYTGLADGRIVEIDTTKNNKLRQLLKFKTSKSCIDNIATKADECGRFLQLRFHNDTLYALEANTGLYKIDIKTGTKTFVGPKISNKVVLYNSFAFDTKETNLVYVTVSSTKWDLLKIMWIILERENSGQVLALDVKSGESVVLFDKLSTANGVDVDSKRDQLLFCESTIGRVNRVALGEVRSSFKSGKGSNKVASLTKNALIPLTPGFPDNINVEGDLAYIALPFVKQHGNELIDNLSTMPNVRKAIGRFIYGVGKLLEYVSVNFYPHPLLETAFSELKCGHFIYRLLQNDKSAVIEYNLATGSSKILGSDKFGFISEAVTDNKGSLLLGSFRSPFIVKVKV